MCQLIKYFIIFNIASQSFGMNEKYTIPYSYPILPIITNQPQYIIDTYDTYDTYDDINTMIDHGENYTVDLD